MSFLCKSLNKKEHRRSKMSSYSSELGLKFANREIIFISKHPSTELGKPIFLTCVFTYRFFIVKQKPRLFVCVNSNRNYFSSQLNFCPWFLTSDVLKEDIYNIFHKIENRTVYPEMWISCKKRPQAKNPVYCHNQKSTET